MRLYEYEGKDLFKKVKIEVPESYLVSAIEDLEKIPDSLNNSIVKAQLLTGKRGKLGAIQKANSKGEIKSIAGSFLNKNIKNETVKKVLVEQSLEIAKEYYLSISYDADTRMPCIIFSEEGGMDIEEVKEKKPYKVVCYHVDLSMGFHPWMSRRIAKDFGLRERRIVMVSDIIYKLFQCFERFDCRVAEINPLIETKDGKFIAADAKIEIDNDALYRQSYLNLPPREPSGRPPTQRELEAKKIDEDDHRGTCGKSFVELDGDIAIMASGGGGCCTCMDALLEYGGKPANFVEYSGNPSAEKVEKLTKIVLSKPGLNGLWVVGGTANFTDIYDTLSGFLKGLNAISPKPDYPIVIRRGGPRDTEAFEMLKKAAQEEGYDFHLYDRNFPMTATARIMVDLVNEYKRKKGISANADKPLIKNANM